MRRAPALALVALALAGCGNSEVDSSSPRDPAWLPAWTASPTDAGSVPLPAGAVLRQLIAPHAAGTRVRLTLSNRLGAEALPLVKVTIGVQDAGAALVAGSVRTLTFSGAQAVTLAPGASATSDPVEMTVAPFQKLAISFSPAADVQSLPRHFHAFEHPFLSAAGDAADAAATGFTELPGDQYGSWFAISALEVQGGPARAAVVAFGDSITEGYVPAIPCAGAVTEPSIFGADARYPDVLQRRLAAAGRDELVVINAGISGNRVTADGFSADHGPRLGGRIAPDVLALPGVRSVILLVGINDLGLGMPPDAQAVIGGLDDAVRQLQAANLRVVLGTLTPGRGFCMGPLGEQPLVPGVLSGSAEVDAARLEVNDWIRTQSGADAIVDFDACLRDPARPSYLADAYDSGDNLHPNVAGYRALAECVDLESL